MIPAFVLHSLYDKVSDFDGSDQQSLESGIAVAIGWTNVRYCSSDHLWRGTDPADGELKIIPSFLSSIDAAVTVVPDLWIESYSRRFDQTYLAQCAPRGDLGLFRVDEEADKAAVAILLAALSARMMMLTRTKESQDA